MQGKFYVYKIAVIVSLGGLLLGISANISGASEFYRAYFNLRVGSFLEGIGVSITMFSAFIGNFWAGSIANRIGRKNTLFITAILFSFCALGSSLATNYTFFLLTRFIGGLGVGISLVVVPMFIAEFSPPGKRGFLVSFNQLNIGIGFLLAYAINALVVNYVSDPDLIWRWMLGIGFVFPVVYMILLPFVPESPRWLIQNQRIEEAMKIFKKIGGTDYAKKEINGIEINTTDFKKDSYLKSIPVLFSKPMRLVLLVGLSIAFFQMASGINSVMFFVPRIFRMAGFGGSGSFELSNLVGITTVIMTIISMLMIDRLGRKPLLVTGVIIMAASAIIVAAVFNNSSYKIVEQDIHNITAEIEDVSEKQIIIDVLTGMKDHLYEEELVFFGTFKNELVAETSNKIVAEKLYSSYRGTLLDASISINSILAMVAILGFIVGFSISLGPITWALLSEIFPAKVRGLGISVAGTLNGITSFVVTTIFPVELERLGAANTFLIYGILLLIFTTMVVLWFPETKGRSLEEIEKMLMK